MYIERDMPQFPRSSGAQCDASQNPENPVNPDSDKGKRMSEPLKGFIAYSHKDTKKKDELRTRLAVMEQQKKLVTWHDGDITGGGKARQEYILKEVADSDILLYLVSAWSLASENCNKELAEALSANIKVIPIILEHCDWLNHQLSDFQALPDQGKPITKWEDPSEGWQNVVDGIREAVEEIQASVLEDPLPEWVFQQGNFLMMLRQMDGAIEAYSHVIKLNPNYANAYYNRGVAYYAKDDYQNAINDYTKAMNLRPNDTKAYNNRGVAYCDNGDYQQAITDHTKVIELKPNDSIGYNNRGNAYRLKGEVECAITDYNRAIDLNRDFAGAYINRGKAWLHLGQWENARLDLLTAQGMGMNIIVSFHHNYGSISDFEQKYNIQLPPDIAAMLTPQ